LGTRGRFDRLLKEIDRLKKIGEIREKIIEQIADSKYIPKHVDEYFRYASLKRMEYLNKKADIVITHGGVGSIFTSLTYNKPTIVVPRYKRFNEHTDDHQLQITKELEKEEKIIAVYDIKNLKDAIEEAKKVNKRKLLKKREQKSKLLKIIEQYLQNLCG
jgi:UDP-N-acetylglucosamine transferase subunit ALG13